jgi:hypothetical protein
VFTLVEVAVKKTLPSARTKSFGVEPCVPGTRSISCVPAGVPSLRQSSRPLVPSSAAK